MNFEAILDDIFSFESAGLAGLLQVFETENIARRAPEIVEIRIKQNYLATALLIVIF